MEIEKEPLSIRTRILIFYALSMSFNAMPILKLSIKLIGKALCMGDYINMYILYVSSI